jgi:hypothetical protein
MTGPTRGRGEVGLLVTSMSKDPSDDRGNEHLDGVIQNSEEK